jgi:hypothetical protein
MESAWQVLEEVIDVFKVRGDGALRWLVAGNEPNVFSGGYEPVQRPVPVGQ